MTSGIDTTSAAVAGLPQATNARAPDREEPRAVEPSENTSTRTEDQSQEGGAPILQLVRKSAESFSRLLGTLKDPAAAAALSGYTGSVGQQVDTYA